MSDDKFLFSHLSLDQRTRMIAMDYVAGHILEKNWVSKAAEIEEYLLNGAKDADVSPLRPVPTEEEKSNG